MKYITLTFRNNLDKCVFNTFKSAEKVLKENGYQKVKASAGIKRMYKKNDINYTFFTNDKVNYSLVSF